MRVQNDRMFDIAEVPFTQVPEEEKKLYADNIKANATYQGYKFRQVWVRPHPPALLCAFQ